MDFVFRRSYRGPLKAAVFDWAGTTVDYGCCAPAVVFIEVFHRKGVDITMEQAREPMGAHKRDHILRIAQMPPVAGKWVQAHGKAPDDHDIDTLYREFIPLQMNCLADYADLIPGTLDTCKDMRARGMRIGSCSGYTREMMDLLAAEAKKRGFVADCVVAATEVPAGRPEPWMCLRNAEELRVYPMEALVKIGDTIADIEEGLNAGMWTIGLAVCGNEIGLREDEIRTLAPDVFQARRSRAYRRMTQAGAHYVVDSVGDVPPVLDLINARLAQGDRP